MPFRERITYEIVNEPLELEVINGHIPIPDRPGLGVTLNEDLISRCPRVHIA